MNFKRCNTKIPLLDDYYEHFNEDTRLKTRHGNVEFITNIKYIHETLNNDFNKKILDIGAGTGAYSIPLSMEGYNVTAVELVKHNLDQIKDKNLNINCILANAIDLQMIDDETYDLVLLFGPIYHLMNNNDKLLAIKEAKRVLKKDGTLFISYYMNDYAVLTYGFIKGNIQESINNNLVDNNFIIQSKEDDLFSFVTLNDINDFNKKLDLKRIKIIASDGASDYIRTPLNKLSDEDYNLYIKYHLLNCERIDLLGASSHLLDIVKKN